MVSLDPAIGKSGYPLLFQTGETADGRTHLVDRQHPHDLLMELSASYSRKLGADSSVFGYVGLPGEPALGPTAFMHRLSGMDNPEAPLTHHWLDSTHITFGVVTAGYVWRDLKLEASAFNGREPDQYRWNMEVRKFDSASARLSWNPTPEWALQVSHGRLDSPESLEPDMSVKRTTASASYQHAIGGRPMQTTLAWGRNRKEPGVTTDGYLLESALHVSEETHCIRALRTGRQRRTVPGRRAAARRGLQCAQAERRRGARCFHRRPREIRRRRPGQQALGAGGARSVLRRQPDVVHAVFPRQAGHVTIFLRQFSLAHRPPPPLRREFASTAPDYPFRSNARH